MQVDEGRWRRPCVCMHKGGKHAYWMHGVRVCVCVCVCECACACMRVCVYACLHVGGGWGAPAALAASRRCSAPDSGSCDTSVVNTDAPATAAANPRPGMASPVIDAVPPRDITSDRSPCLHAPRRTASTSTACATSHHHHASPRTKPHQPSPKYTQMNAARGERRQRTCRGATGWGGGWWWLPHVCGAWCVVRGLRWGWWRRWRGGACGGSRLRD